MNGKTIAKRINYIFVVTLLALLFKLALILFSSNFAGIGLIELVVLAESIVFWRAFRSDSMEKALNQLSVLKIFSLIIAAYAAYSAVMQVVNWFRVDLYLDFFEIWSLMAFYVLVVLSSLAIFFTATTLMAGDIKKFNVASTVIFVIVAILLFFTVVGLAVSGYLIPILVLSLVPLFSFTMIPKLLGNKIIKGAIVGAIIAGDVGAVVGAIAASKSDKK